MTPLAQTILAELQATPKGLKAYALAKVISEKRGRIVAANSVYRALRGLEREGRVRKIVSANIYCALADLSRQPFCLLTCNICGQIGAVPFREPGRRLKELAEAHGFTPETLVIEVIGNCAVCVR
jgi:Fur family transcriptional regulator, zinc uptake regulator